VLSVTILTLATLPPIAMMSRSSSAVNLQMPSR
jgi:hypothetical protein